MAGLNPEPLLDWNKPYKLEHIEWAIERRGRRHLIDIFPFGEGPVDTTQLKRVCLVEAPKDHWGVWLVQEKNTSLALSAPPSLGAEKGEIFSFDLYEFFFSCIINKFFLFCIINNFFFLYHQQIFFSCIINKFFFLVHLTKNPTTIKNEDSIIIAQSEVIGRTASHVFKVPDCANFKIDCKPSLMLCRYNIK
jgi:hypothetical protein